MNRQSELHPDHHQKRIRGRFFELLFLSLFIFFSRQFSWGQTTNSLIINADAPVTTISRAVYGQFIEHLGRCIYDGIWVGEGSSIPNTRGIRNDVTGALRKLDVPVLRWPGGCFADRYHWKNGIGPRDQRSRQNQFGTHEFMDLCEQIGTEPYVCGNLGSGTIQEMVEWVEYMTSGSPDSEMANLRRKNGREKPWKVPYFGIGNETMGCGGGMTPEYYSDLYRRYQAFVPNPPGYRMFRVACGPNAENYEWTKVMMEKATRVMRGLSLHYYTYEGGDFKKKGSATSFGEEQWMGTMRFALKMEDLVVNHSAIMDKYDPQKRVGLVVDEWGTWYDPEPGATPLFQPVTLRDALVAGLTLNIFNNHAERVKMANLAQMVNVLAANIQTEGEKMTVTPTYHVFEMYKGHKDAELLRTDFHCEHIQAGPGGLPSLSVSASKNKEQTLTVSICNLDPRKPAELACVVRGFKMAEVAARVLTGEAMNAQNTFEHPNRIQPVALNSVKLRGDQISLALPPKSVTVLTIK